MKKGRKQPRKFKWHRGEKSKSVKEKVVEMEGRQRKNNIHMTGVPGKEKQNAGTDNI